MQSEPTEHDPQNYIREPKITFIWGIVVGVIIGFIISTNFHDQTAILDNYLPEILGIAFTVGFIDQLYAYRDRQHNIQRLIREFGGQSNPHAQVAADELRDLGLLTNGFLAKRIFQDAKLFKANLASADLQGADIRFSDLHEAILRNANLKDADLTATNFFMAKLPAANLSGAQLWEAELHQADLTAAYLYKARLRHVKLNKAYLHNADLREAELYLADLQEAKLPEANLSGANMVKANLKGAILTGADLQNADLKDAIYDETTKLPTGLTWHPSTDMSQFTNTSHPEFWRSRDPNSPAYSGNVKTDEL